MSEVTISINEEPLRGIEGVSIQRNLDNIADGFSFSIAYDPDADNARLLEPPQKDVTLEINGDLYMRAISEKWDPDHETSSNIATIECRTRPGVLSECTPTTKATTYKKQTLKQIADTELKPFGILAEIPDGDSPPIAMAQKCPVEPIGNFLKKLACNYEFLMNSTNRGNLVFVKPGIQEGAEIVHSIAQGEPPYIGVSASYDYSKVFSDYSATGQFPGNPDAIATVTDPSAVIFRPIMFKSDAKDQATLKKAAEWRMTRALASFEWSVTVDGWFNRNEHVWLENTLIELWAPKVYLFEPFNYLIKNVTLDKTESGGETATLTLVMPESFTGKFPKKLPWIRG